MLSIDKINELKYTTSMANCHGCTNNCRLTINKFTGGRQFVSGNRCERGIGKEKNKDHIPNLYEYKYKRLFSYAPLSPEKAVRGRRPARPVPKTPYLHVPFSADSPYYKGNGGKMQGKLASRA